MKSKGTYISMYLNQRKKLKVELLTSEHDKEIGYMFKDSITDSEGKLFVYKNKGSKSFWMKNVNFPLDIVSLDNYGKILDIQTLPAYNKNSSRIPSHRTPSGTYSVLEVLGNTMYKNKVFPGNVLVVDKFI